MRVCVKLCLVNHTLKYGTLFDGEELARKATLMRTADRLQTKIGLQSNKCKLMVRFNKSYNQERYLSSWLADLKWTATTLLKNSSILESLKRNFAPVPRPQETFQCQTSSVLQELFAMAIWIKLYTSTTLYSKNQIVLSILADFTGSLIVLGRICQMYTISVFKTVSDESVQAIHACQIGRGKLPTKKK